MDVPIPMKTPSKVLRPFRQELFAFESGQVKLNAANGEILSLKRFVRSSIGKPLNHSLLAISVLISESPKAI